MTRLSIVARVGPHWQPTSLAAQPAAETAEAMQDVAQGGSAARVCAAVRGRKMERAKSLNFMIAERGLNWLIYMPVGSCKLKE